MRPFTSHDDAQAKANKINGEFVVGEDNPGSNGKYFIAVSQNADKTWNIIDADGKRGVLLDNNDMDTAVEGKKDA